IMGAQSSCALYHFIFCFLQLCAAPPRWLRVRQTHTDLATVGSLDVATTLNNMSQLDVSSIIHVILIPSSCCFLQAWIGLYEDIQSWRWSLVNDSFYQGYSTQYRNWISGQPDNAGSNEPCSEMNDLGQWNDLPCEATLEDCNSPPVWFKPG
uniref:C-type lectin domain-containing protein n=1 Tax=Poecilia latipinna TaxID=48699 RepID=A0A3B3VVN2_9TELE